MSLFFAQMQILSAYLNILVLHTLKLVLEGKLNGRRQWRSQRLKYLEGMAVSTGSNAVESWTDDCASFRHMLAKSNPDTAPKKTKKIV